MVKMFQVKTKYRLKLRDSGKRYRHSTRTDLVAAPDEATARAVILEAFNCDSDRVLCNCRAVILSCEEFSGYFVAPPLHSVFFDSAA